MFQKGNSCIFLIKSLRCSWTEYPHETTITKQRFSARLRGSYSKAIYKRAVLKNSQNSYKNNWGDSGICQSWSATVPKNDNTAAEFFLKTFQIAFYRTSWTPERNLSCTIKFQIFRDESMLGAYFDNTKNFSEGFFLFSFVFFSHRKCYNTITWSSKRYILTIQWNRSYVKMNKMNHNYKKKII